ncbi:MAG: branched-chain amino acid ABC transporter permease [Roseiflexaceae bacterium]|nr:branched-chain amino acid ABC transporter permease [Roseiflexaceae bacterium]
MTTEHASSLRPAAVLAAQRGWWRLLPLVALALLPLVAPPFWRSLTLEVLALAIFAMSLDVLIGYTGLVSFGHAAFLGFGAYAAAFTTERVSENLLVVLPICLASVALYAVVVGFLALRTSGISFLMLTLAFSQMLFGLAIRWSRVTGGSDGLSVARPHIGLGAWQVPLGPDLDLYYLVLAAFAASWWLLSRLVASPFGHTLRGIKENAQRMQALGYRTRRFELAAFVVAAVFAGLAGMLLAMHNRYVSPDTFAWTTSGQGIIMVIVGGAGTLVGPILGALLVHLLESVGSSATESWRLIMGVVFVLFVLFAPKGIIGILRRLRRSKESPRA